MTCRPAGAPMTPLNVTLWTAQSKQRQGTTRGGKPTAPSVQRGPHNHGDGSAGVLRKAGRHVVTSCSHAVLVTEPSQVWRLSSEFIPLCILQVMLQCHAALVIF
ncbi:hypothetical protein PCANC_04952 [Puccinia coronata f. sp. avenae]|uniref:Uncharacterized protein n=1 Tax=Puccinia coronata f. sp. avenae TaxID=200324 RepID=A0A2N5VWI4_9BASI|nr:hypothetical protein PCANC_04952 [Puccinia coronata f. sp. avenae]